jgi:hypothetical protein
LDQENITNWQYSRLLAGKIYFEWIKKVGLVELLLRPETIPSLFYQTKWDSENQDIVQGILRFLQSFSILEEAGGTFSMKENYTQQTDYIAHQVKDINQGHPSLQFIEYGLKLLDSKLEGDTGLWDIERKSYLLEIGFDQKAFIEFGNLVNKPDTFDWKFRPIENPTILIFANYISNTVNSLLSGNDINKNITIITHDLKHKDRAITFCELKKETSNFSNRIFTLEEYKSDTKYDLIIVPNMLAFNDSPRNQLNLLKSLSSENALLCLYAPTEAKYSLGIEPIFYLHPDYKGVPNTREFLRQAKSVGWSKDMRMGINDEILLLKMD